MNRPIHGGNLSWAADLAGCSPHSILDFSASINPLGPPQSAIAAIQGHLDTLTSYPDPSYGSICQTLSQIHQLPVDWFIPGNGSAELLTWACRDLAQFSSTAMVTPAFSDYRRALKAFEARICAYPIDLPSVESLPSSDLMDQVLALMGQSTDLSKSGLLLNNPHNPTGQLLSIDQMEQLLNQFALVVVDEAFMDFVPYQEQFSLIPRVQAYQNLIILRSLTKFYSLPGLRLGYAVGHPEHLQRWQQWRDPWTVNSLAIAAGKAVLKDYAFQEQTLSWLPYARSQLTEGLLGLGMHPWPSAANFILVATHCSVPSLQESLLKHHQILIRDCLSFPELGERFFRVAVRSVEENLQLLNALANCLPSLSV